MMGFGATDPIVWLLGVLAMIVIWGGVWWGLSTLVFHWPARERTPSAADRRRLDEPDTQPWRQPTFDPAPRGPEAEPGAPQVSPDHPPAATNYINTESDYR